MSENNQESEREREPIPTEPTPFPAGMLAAAESESQVRQTVRKWLWRRATEYSQQSESAEQWAENAATFEEYLDARDTVTNFEHAEEITMDLAQEVSEE